MQLRESVGAVGAGSWFWSRTGVLVCAVVLMGGTAGCSSSRDGVSASASASASVRASTGASPSPSVSPSVSPSPSPSGGGPTPTPGPSVIAKVGRPGAPKAPSVSAAPSTFKAPVSYADGVTVRVDRVSSGVESGQGPGVFAGREFAVFTVTMHNGTAKPLDAQQVVVSATYGKRNLVGERVYAADAVASDFGGRLAPGANATARYAFAVPAKQLGDVRLVVDFDGVHTSALFDGDARQVS